MNRTPTQTACAVAHSVSPHTLNIMITFHHANTRGTRLHIFLSQNSCHPRVMSRSLPQLTLTTNTSSLSPTSPTSPIFPTFSPSHRSPLAHDPLYLAKIHGRVADQHKSHLSQEELEEELQEPEKYPCPAACASPWRLASLSAMTHMGTSARIIHM